MKHNMCVTIDRDVHSWLSNKPGKLSPRVNRILLNEMIREKKMLEEKKNKENNRPRLVSRYCSNCDTTQTGPNPYCVNQKCDQFLSQRLEEME